MERDKLIFVYYIDVREVHITDRSEFMSEVTKKILPTYNSEAIFVPILGETRVECINPVYITDGELIKKHERLMAELHEHLKNQLDE